jgi:hypothetical protein
MFSATVGDRLGDFIVAQAHGARGLRRRVHHADDDVAGELEDDIGSGIVRARTNRIVNLNT